MASRTWTRWIGRGVLAIVGLVVGLALVEGGFRVASVVYRSALDRQARSRLGEDGVFRILCIGESTTRGVGDNNWPRILGDRLAQHCGTSLPIDVVNLGLPAVHSAVIAAHLGEWLELYRPDIVVTMVGINDDLNLLVTDRPTDASPPWPARLRVVRFARLSLRAILANRPPSDQPATADPTPAPASTTEPSTADRIADLEAELARTGDRLDDLEELERLAQAIGDVDLAIDALERQARVDPAGRSAAFYVNLANLIRGHVGDEAWAARYFELALTINPDELEPLVRLGDVLRDSNPDRAQTLLERAVRAHPTSHLPSIFLSNVYHERGRADLADATLDHAVARFEDALARDPQNRDMYQEYATFNHTLGRVDETMEVYRRALVRFPDDEHFARALGNLQFEGGDFESAVTTFTAIAKSPQYADRLQEVGDLETLAVSLLLQHKGAGKVQKFLAATGRKLEPVNAFTQTNYLAMADMIRERGIRHVAMQYPTLPVETLRATLRHRADIVYVDDGEVFRDALDHEPYDDLFTDRFAGGFGHMTEHGHNLLVDQLLDALEPLLPSGC
jgi:tetratricopeptide (TPR) repeat protein